MKRRTGYYLYTLTLKRWLFTALALLLSASVFATGENNVRLYGALVAEPCVVQPGDEDIHLDFSSVIDKMLYQNSRTPGQSFAIHLQGCDLSLGNMVAVTFHGVENSILPGLLAIDSSSQAKGIAVGLETAEAKALPLNATSNKYRLQKGSNVIALKAYVQGEPEAIASQKIERGSFSATATFNLEYE
ncbi:fimbrial protein [Erwinia sp. AnSW2-5]|uniref:fimbrial protein n=1 Tax=Erwinia sp. AnSW2-5 TaxID=3367692 RepID=UPI0038597C0C